MWTLPPAKTPQSRVVQACVENKFGRPDGYMALQNNTTGKTQLDIESASKHDVLRSKQVVIRCGGRFRHECANKYSVVAHWMSVDLAPSR